MAIEVKDVQTGGGVSGTISPDGNDAYVIAAAWIDGNMAISAAELDEQEMEELGRMGFVGRTMVIWGLPLGNADGSQLGLAITAEGTIGGWGAIAFSGVNQSTPLRDVVVMPQSFQPGAGAVVESEEGDLVLLLALTIGNIQFGQLSMFPVPDELWAVETHATMTSGAFMTEGEAEETSIAIGFYRSGDPFNADQHSTGISLIPADGEPPPPEAPTLSNASAQATGPTTAAGSVETDVGEGTLYFVVTESSSAPTAEQIIAGEDDQSGPAAYADSQEVAQAGTQFVTASGLDPETEYWMHFVQVDDDEDASNVASSSAFTTPATGGGIAPYLIVRAAAARFGVI